jgi:hypothetical protein
MKEGWKRWKPKYDENDENSENTHIYDGRKRPKTAKTAKTAKMSHPGRWSPIFFDYGGQRPQTQRRWRPITPCKQRTSQNTL